MADEEKQFTQADIDKAVAEATAKHQEEMNSLAGKIRAEEKAKADKAKEEAAALAKRANMSELEKATTEANDWKTKYEESQNQIEIAKQKDDTRAYLKEIGVAESNLDFCFIPKDLEGTKARAKSLKEMIDNVKKQTFEDNAGSKIPKGGKHEDLDASIRKAMGLK